MIRDFILGEYPDVHCLSVVLFMSMGFILRYGFGCDVRAMNINKNLYFKKTHYLIREIYGLTLSVTNIYPSAEAVLQCFLIFYILSLIVYLKEKYTQLDLAGWNSSSNFAMYCFGLVIAILFPMITVFSVIFAYKRSRIKDLDRSTIIWKKSYLFLQFYIFGFTHLQQNIYIINLFGVSEGLDIFMFVGGYGAVFGQLLIYYWPVKN